MLNVVNCNNRKGGDGVARVEDVASFFITLGQQQADNEIGDQVSHLRLETLFCARMSSCQIWKTAFWERDIRVAAWPGSSGNNRKYKNMKRRYSCWRTIRSGYLTRWFFLLLMMRTNMTNSPHLNLFTWRIKQTPWAQSKTNEVIPISNKVLFWSIMQQFFWGCAARIEVIHPDGMRRKCVASWKCWRLGLTNERETMGDMVCCRQIWRWANRSGQACTNYQR